METHRIVLSILLGAISPAALSDTLVLEPGSASEAPLVPDGSLTVELRVHAPGSGGWPVGSPVSVTLPEAAALIREPEHG